MYIPHPNNIGLILLAFFVFFFIGRLLGSRIIGSCLSISIGLILFIIVIVLVMITLFTDHYFNPWYFQQANYFFESEFWLLPSIILGFFVGFYFRKRSS